MIKLLLSLLLVCSLTIGFTQQFQNEHIVSSTLTSANDVNVADLDGDGLLDIIAAAPASDKVVWYRNLDNLEFSDEIILCNDCDPLRIQRK
jgi:hypothetical protein